MNNQAPKKHLVKKGNVARCGNVIVERDRFVTREKVDCKSCLRQMKKDGHSWRG